VFLPPISLNPDQTNLIQSGMTAAPLPDSADTLWSFDKQAGFAENYNDTTQWLKTVDFQPSTLEMEAGSGYLIKRISTPGFTWTSIMP
jgi:hypothetical protein